MIGWLKSVKNPALAGFFVCAALLLTGCATPQMATLGAGWPDDLVDQAELTHVPFYPQEDYECGPASLAMVAGAAGVHVLPDALVEQVYLPGRQGSLQLEMLAATRRQGLVAYPLGTRVETLMREVAAGNPVLVFQNLAFSFYPVWHYAVVIGFDRERNVLLLHSGTTKRLEMSLFTFERTWARADYWAMVALPPGQLPATVDSQTYTASVAALERVNPLAAQTSYASALQRWPGDTAALFGMGNTAYTLGQRDVALKAYQAAVQQHPAFADGWNNLAQVQLEKGEFANAAASVAQAVALGGVRLPRYLALQARIKAQSSR